MSKRKSGLYRKDFLAIWVFWLLSFLGVFCYVTDDLSKTMAYAIPKDQITGWHSIFGVLSNRLIMPIQHWISLLLLLYFVCRPFTAPELVSRFGTKRRWKKTVTGKAVGFALLLALAGFALTFVLAVLLYGIPQAELWSKHPFTNIPLPVVLGTTLAVHCTMSVFVAVVYVSCVLLFYNPALSAVGCAVWLVLGDLGQLLTPPYMSFKAVFFTSSFSFAYFLSGGYLTNLLLSVVLPWLLIGAMLLLSNTYIRRFPERWAES